MLYSCSKFDIDLKNKYSLKTFFILHKLTLDNYMNLNATIVAPIKHKNVFDDDINLDTLYVSSASITFHLKIDNMLWYKVICNYDFDYISNISEYLRSYSELEGCWTEHYDYENNNLVNIYRNDIKALIKTCFKRIKTLYTSTDSDMIDAPWFYNNMKMFEQTISLKAQNFVKKYVNSLQTQLILRTYYNSQLQKRILNNWKEWYFCPENENGYLKKLRTSYDCSKKSNSSYII
jgi:hypothetical protein